MNADTRAPEVGGLVAVSLVILVFYPMIKHARLVLKSTRLRFEVGWKDEVESA
jgi:hypothetical protein